MRPHRDLETFETEIRAAVGAVLPATHVRLVERTLVAIKLRVDLSSGRFIDIFFNGCKWPHGSERRRG